MPSEERLRAEMHRIANGVEVDTDARLAAVIAQPRGHGRARTPRVGSRRRRLLVPLAAAASIACVAVAGTTLTGILTGGEPYADMSAPVVLAGTPGGTVPSVFGHTRESASVLLRELGIELRYGKEISCDPAGRPVGTEPATGTPVSAGETVTVQMSYQGANTDCMTDLREPWRFLDFATGRGPSPRFADEVGLFVNGARTGTLSGAEAARG